MQTTDKFQINQLLSNKNWIPHSQINQLLHKKIGSILPGKFQKYQLQYKTQCERQSHESVCLPGGYESSISSQEFANVSVQVTVLRRIAGRVVSTSGEEEIDVQ